MSHSTAPRTGQGGCCPIGTKPTRHPLPPDSLKKSSYSPLLDFLLRNCKRKQKSSLLVQGGVPGDGQTLGSLPPACPSPPRPMACLPLSGHRPALSKDMPPGAQPPVRISVFSAPSRGTAGRPPPDARCAAGGLPRTACHSRGWLLPAVLGRAGRAGQRLGHSLFHCSVLGAVGEGTGFPGRSAALPACGGPADGPGPLLGPTAPSAVPSSARPSSPSRWSVLHSFTDKTRTESQNEPNEAAEPRAKPK